MLPFEFANDLFLYLLLIIVPLMVVWYILKQKDGTASLQVSSLKAFQGGKHSFRVYLRHFLFLLRIIAVSGLLLVLARPQSSDNWQDVTTEGIDIVIALDISSSMLARDFSPNRLEASKEVAVQFISGRPLDRIGLVVFSGESFTQCPLTTDHAVLINLFQELESGMIEDGTAIGMGLATAVNRLKDSEAISRVVILLTDGVNNRGSVAPLTAAEIAATFGVRVYTIGVGSHGTAPYPVQTAFGTKYQQMPVEIDEETLQEIAQITEGKYFRADNADKLKAIYEEIDQMEKAKIEVQEYSNKDEEFFWFAVMAAIAIFLEILLKHTLLRNIP